MTVFESVASYLIPAQILRGISNAWASQPGHFRGSIRQSGDVAVIPDMDRYVYDIRSCVVSFLTIAGAYHSIFQVLFMLDFFAGFCILLYTDFLLIAITCTFCAFVLCNISLQCQYSGGAYV